MEIKRETGKRCKMFAKKKIIKEETATQARESY